MLATFFIYLLKSAVCLLVFSLFFRLLLLSDTFVRFSRMVLLSGITLCLLLPLCRWQIEEATPVQQSVSYVENLLETEMQVQNEVQSIELTADENEATLVVEQQDIWQKPVFWVLLAYALGVVFMLGRLLVSFVNLWQIARKGERKMYENQWIILTERKITAFSFFRYVVLSRQDFEGNPQEIITHEQMHSKYWHSIDALFVELLLVVQWFNVGLWSLRHDLRALHEYEADRGVLQKGIDVTKYQLLLVKKAVGERCFTSVVNSFNHSFIKNRITMMLKKKTNPLARLKVILMLPLAVEMLYAFAHPNVEETLDAVQQDVQEVVDVREEPKALNLWKRIVESSWQDKKDKEFLLSLNKNGLESIHAAFINKYYNQLMYNGRKFPVNFDVEKLAEFISEEYYSKYKRSEGGGKELVAQFVTLHYDKSAKIQDIVRFTSALMKGYDQAIRKIAKENDISYGEMSNRLPLLIVNKYPSLIPPPPPPPGYVKKQKTKDIVEVTEEEMPKQCHIEALSSDVKGMCMAVNFPVEILREFLNPEHQSLANVSSFSMYLGEADKVKTGKVSDVKSLLRAHKIRRVNYDLGQLRQLNYFDYSIPCIYPLEVTAIKNTIGFGMRMHPILKTKKVHTGVDFSAEKGTSVIATAKGVVVSVVRSDKGFGNKIIIKHNETYQTSYAHLQSIVVKEGQQVAKGQLIGTVGSTGASTAPHLHYEVIKEGKNVNPRNYFSKK